jgi:hypothetical protein
LGGGLVEGGQEPSVDPSRLAFAALPAADYRAVDAQVLLADRGCQGIEPLVLQPHFAVFTALAAAR